MLASAGHPYSTLLPSDLLPGDIGFSSIRGAVGAGVLAGQTAIDLAALLRGFPGQTSGWITHAFIVAGVRPDGFDVVEAMPSGARLATAGADRVVPGYAYARLSLDGDCRERIAAAARSMVGIPYGFSHYAAIAGLTLAGGTAASPTGVLARRVLRRRPGSGLPRRAICSQICDEAYRLAGVRLFTDGRPAAYVTPGALWWRAAQLGEIWVC